MGRTLPIVFGVLCLAIGVQVFLKWGSASGLGYVGDWQTAKKEALAEKKPIILVFGGPW